MRPSWAVLFLLLLSCSATWAADKSGVSPTTISLPKGPGSIEGLGESFQPSLNTGTAKYRVGLKLPRGTAGHGPGLELAYEGGTGNGVLGLGWMFGAPAVQRRSDKGIPTYGEAVGFTREDVFLNEQNEELVPMPDGYYFCKNESSFIRYRQVSNHWESTLPDGSRLEYGLTPEGRTEDGPSGRVYSWLAQRQSDVHGNTILYSYESFAGDHNRNQKYLALIRYGPGPPPWDNFHFVRFIYEDRPDWFEDCRSGFVIRTGKRLKRIIVGTQGPTLAGHAQGDFSGDGMADNLNRIYELEYVPYAGTNSHWSLLGSIRLIGADGTNALPPATFGYVISNPPDELSAADREIGGVNEPTLVMDNERVDLLDLNADGLPDVLRTGGATHLAWLNRGETNELGMRMLHWVGPVEVASASGDAWQFELSSAGTHLADMDGDGLADLVHKAADGSVFYFGNQAQHAWGERQPMSAEFFAPPAPFGTPDVRTADIDFDKRMDLIRGDGLVYQVWFNFGQNQYSERITVLADVGFDFSLPGVQIADLNGDRVPDVARVRPAAVQVTAGLGYGRFAELISVPIPDGPLDDMQAERAKLTDINGDGLADLVLERAEPGVLWYWVNLGNYTLSGRKRITGMPVGVGPNPEIRWADMNGNGATDLVYADSSASPRLCTVDLGELINGGGTPNALVAISNGIGRAMLIRYESSTKFAVEDAVAGRAWPDPMPNPMSVVAEMTILDSLGHSYAVRYRYHDGYYDRAERQFRGFGSAEEIEVGDATAPTLVTRSQFNTGRVHEALKGKLRRMTAEQEDGQVFWEEATEWTDPPRVLMTGTNGTNVVYVHPVSTVRTIRELGRGTERRLEREVEYDRFGNVVRQADFGIVENGDRSAFDDERVVTTEYAVNTNAWLLHFPCRVQLMDENGRLVARSEIFYDDETFSGDNFGQVTHGNTTLKRDWIDPTNDSAFVQSTRMQYDSYGNPIIALEPLGTMSGGSVDFSKGHARELEYDVRFHSFPVLERIHVGGGSEPLVFQARYDEGFGTVTSVVDFNGAATTYGYDVWSRVLWSVRPGDTADYPTVEYEYAHAVPFNSTGRVNYVETRQLDKLPGTAGTKRAHYFISRHYSDGLGRALLIKSEAEPEEPGGPPRVAVAGAVQFNARRQISHTMQPFFTLAVGSSLEDLLSFENIETPGWQGSFELDGALATLDWARAPKTAMVYDALGRPAKTINPDGTFTETVYEPLLTQSYDENDANPTSPHHETPTVYHNDGLGRLVRVDELCRLHDDGTPSDAVSVWTTSYEYDLNDMLTRLTDSQNNVRQYAYDGLKRKTLMSDPDGGLARWTYDEASNLIESTDAEDQRITYTYDGASRILTEDYHDEASSNFSYGRSPDVRYHYDTPADGLDMGDQSTRTAANTRGALAWVEDGSGEEHVSYDARGRTEWVVKRLSDAMLDPDGGGTNQAALVSYCTRFQYDSLDRLTRLVYPDLDEISYQYNQQLFLRRIVGGPSGCIVSNVLYWPGGYTRRVEYGNGVRTECSSNLRLRPARLRTVAGPPDLGTELVHFEYEFDPVLNVQAIHDRRPATAIPGGDQRRNTQRYEYDDLDRLTRVQYSFNAPGEPAGNDGEIRYRYDRLGNLLAQTSTIRHLEAGLPVTDLGRLSYGGTGGSSGRFGRTPTDPPGPHALSEIQNAEFGTRTCSYDANGNITELDGQVFTYDGKARLVRIETSEMRAEYRYDYTDRRVAKRVWPKASPTGPASSNSPASTVWYVKNYFEIRDGEQPTKYVWAGAARVARVIGSLSNNPRLQRLRVHPGWNLLATAVGTTNTVGQWEARTEPAIDAVYRWNPATRDYVEVGRTEALPAGTVLWLRSQGAGVLILVGTYVEPGDAPLNGGGEYVPGPGLEALALSNALPSGTVGWTFDARTQHWGVRLTNGLNVAAPWPRFLPPGESWFVTAGAPGTLRAPDPSLRVCYYHKDHLSSASCVTDAQGRLVEENAYYPFGVRRVTHRPRGVSEPYGFTQKEQDAESGLHYFESRYLAGHLGCFLQFDPLSAGVTADRLADPQRAHPYGYARNNPLARVDPLGLDDEEQESAWSLTWRAIKSDVSQTIEGVAEKANAIYENPVSEGLPLVGDVAVSTLMAPVAPLMTAASGLMDVGEAASGYEIDMQRGQIMEMNDDQRLGKVQGSLLKISATASTIAGGVAANARLAAANSEMALESARAVAAKAARAAAQSDPKSALLAENLAKNLSVPEAFGKTGVRPGPLCVDPHAPSPSYKATLPGSAEAAAQRTKMWVDFVMKRIEETKGQRDMMMRTKGTAISVLKGIWQEADRKFGRPVLPGD